MNKYPHIDTVFKRDPTDKYKSLLIGQYSQSAFEYLRDNAWLFTEKVDGTNIRVIIASSAEGGVPYYTFRGKRDKAEIPPFLLEKLVNIFEPIKEILFQQFPDGACLYGEGYGAKIQKGGGNYCQDHGFVLFDVKVGDWWLERYNVEEIAQKLGLRVVPIIGSGTLDMMVTKAREGFNSVWGDFLAEGIVARPAIELQNRNGSRIITKIKHKDFLHCK